MEKEKDLEYAEIIELFSILPPISKVETPSSDPIYANISDIATSKEDASDTRTKPRTLDAHTTNETRASGERTTNEPRASDARTTNELSSSDARRSNELRASTTFKRYKKLKRI